jgi:hypothetical protein
MMRADVQYALDWSIRAKTLDLLQERADTEIMVVRGYEFLHIVPIFIGLRAGSLTQKTCFHVGCRRDEPRLRSIWATALDNNPSFPSRVAGL